MKNINFFRSVTSASPPNQGCQDSTSPNLDDEKTAEYIKELQAERDCLESMQDAKVANAVKLLDQGKILNYYLFDVSETKLYLPIWQPISPLQ